MRVTVVSAEGKEATISLVGKGDFVGEEALAALGGKRLSTATCMSACTALKISRDEMLRALKEERIFSDLFMKFLLARSMRIQADLVDQLFNSSEKRLARILLLMAEFGKPPEDSGSEGRHAECGPLHSQSLAGDAGGDDRHHAVAGELFYEPVPQAGFHQLQRRHFGSQVAAGSDFARQPAGRCTPETIALCGLIERLN